MTRASLLGRRFGELTVTALVGRDHLGLVWLCVCDCGREALRTTAALLRSEKRGDVPACRICLAEANGGRFVERHAAHMEAWKQLWANAGTLYSDAALASIERDIRAEMAEEFGPLVERAALPAEVVEGDETTAADFEVGDGGGRDGAAMSEIAEEFGVSTSRASQMVAQALAAFARRWKQMLPKDSLPWIVTGRDPSRAPRIVEEAQINAALSAASLRRAA